jgi:putative hemolysin
MMPLEWAIAALVLAAAATLFFSTLTYALRDISRARLADYLQRHRRSHRLEATIEHVSELVFVTAVGRLLANTMIVLASVWICQNAIARMATRDLAIFALAAVITLFFSVAIPQAITTYAGDAVVGACAGLLHILRLVSTPITWVMHLTDRFVRNAAGASAAPEPEQIEQEVEQDILSAVEEGEERGVVDTQEREMIQSVIELHDSNAGHVMTARTDIVAIDIKSDLDQVKRAMEDSGHSRIPVHEGSLDHIVGILYARDLLKHLGQPPGTFDARLVMRPPFFVPETTPLGNLLRDFRIRKVHMAIVLDEYGSTSGLVTVEDIVSELVGNISDEHEPVEPSIFKRIDDHTYDADARIDIEELNRLTGLDLPEDTGYATLGGFVLAILGRIPETGASFEHRGAKYTVLAAEPQRVNRVRIDRAPQPAGAAHGEPN